jgi:hypothetical protein
MDEMINEAETVLNYPDRKLRSRIYSKLLSMAKAIVGNPVIRKKADHDEKNKLGSLRSQIKKGSYSESYWINFIEMNSDYRIIMVNKNDKIMINGEKLIVD